MQTYSSRCLSEEASQIAIGSFPIGVWLRGVTRRKGYCFVLASKLKALKEDLKKWNGEKFGHIYSWKSMLLNELCGLDWIVEKKALSMRSLAQGRCYYGIGVLWKKWVGEKLRTLWLREGDGNIKFFHWVANLNRRNNWPRSLVMINGCLIRPYNCNLAYCVILPLPILWIVLLVP